MSRSTKAPWRQIGHDRWRKRQYQHGLRRQLDQQIRRGDEDIAKKKPCSTDGYALCDGRLTLLLPEGTRK
jgi:hypothetical protein